MKNLALRSIVAAVALSFVLALGAATAQRTVSSRFSQDVRACESWYPLGEQVTVIYTIRNTGSSACTFQFSTGKQCDVWITSAGNEVFRLSKGKMYAQAFSNIVLKPGESKEFRATWDQKDSQGKPVTSGWFTIHAQLMPIGDDPYEVSSRFWVGDPNLVVVPMSVSVLDATNRAVELAGKSVVITAIYKGWKADPNDKNLKDGPPITRSDWVIADATGSMYVTGPTTLDPARNAGARVKVTGKLCRTPNGQVYLTAETVQPN